MSQCDHLRPIGNVHSMGTRRSPSIKMAVFLEVKLFLRLPSRKKAVFFGREVANKKETSSKGCLHDYLVMRSLDYARDDIDQITYSAQ